MSPVIGGSLKLGTVGGAAVPAGTILGEAAFQWMMWLIVAGFISQMCLPGANGLEGSSIATDCTALVRKFLKQLEDLIEKVAEELRPKWSIIVWLDLSPSGVKWDGDVGKGGRYYHGYVSFHAPPIGGFVLDNIKRGVYRNLGIVDTNALVRDYQSHISNVHTRVCWQINLLDRDSPTKLRVVNEEFYNRYYAFTLEQFDLDNPDQGTYNNNSQECKH